MKSSDIFRVSPDTKIEFLPDYPGMGVEIRVRHQDCAACVRCAPEVIPHALEEILRDLERTVGRRMVRGE